MQVLNPLSKTFKTPHISNPISSGLWSSSMPIFWQNRGVLATQGLKSEKNSLWGVPDLWVGGELIHAYIIFLFPVIYPTILSNTTFHDSPAIKSYYSTKTPKKLRGAPRELMDWLHARTYGGHCMCHGSFSAWSSQPAPLRR